VKSPRLARLSIAALLALAWVGPKTPLGYLGLIPLATGLVGTCPAYSLLRVSTNRRGRR